MSNIMNNIEIEHTIKLITRFEAVTNGKGYQFKQLANKLMKLHSEKQHYTLTKDELATLDKLIEAEELTLAIGNARNKVIHQMRTLQGNERGSVAEKLVETVEHIEDALTTSIGEPMYDKETMENCKNMLADLKEIRAKQLINAL